MNTLYRIIHPLFKNKIVSRYLFRFFPYGIMIVSTAAILLLHAIDKKVEHNVFIAGIWAVLFLSSVFFAVKTYVFKKISLVKTVSSNEILIFFLVLTAAIITRFYLLGIYPYVITGDEVRDAGLNALNMKIHPPIDVFDFGSYAGYGNFIPFISYLFSFIFSNTRYSYIVPSAIAGIISIVCTYFIGRKIGGRMVGFAAAIFLVGSLHHMHYSRTELLIVIDSMLSPLVILSAYSATRSRKGFLLFGMFAGMTLHFYAGIRGVLLASSMFLLIYCLKKIFASAYSQDRKKAFQIFTYYIIAFFVFMNGFILAAGPTLRIMHKNAVLTESGNRQMIFKNAEYKNKPLNKKIEFIYKTYERSFLVYFANNMGSHFPNREMPLLSFPVNWLFIVGIVSILLRHKNHSRLAGLLLLCIFTVPFTNQTLLNDVGADHRLMSLVPVLCIIAAMGLSAISETRFAKISSIIVGGTAGLFLIMQTGTYFYSRTSDTFYDLSGTKEYILQTMIEYTKSRPDDRTYYLVNRNPNDYNLMHYIEKMDYLMYPKQMKLIEKESLANLDKLADAEDKQLSVLYIDPVAPLEQYKGETVVVHCSKQIEKIDYRCPAGWLQDYSFGIAEID